MDDTLLGLTEYEGKVYRALLQEPGATAYRLGKRSGVPLSRVYEVAERLADKGAAIREDGEPARYTAVDPATLVDTARSSIAGKLDAISQELSSLASSSDPSTPMWIRGEARVESHLRAALAGVESEIVVVAGQAETSRIRRLIDRRVRMHAIESKTGFAILIDRKTALFGKFGPQADLLSTNHPALVELIAGQVPDARPQRITVVAEPGGFEAPASWLGWEEEKHRRLLRH